MAALLSELTKQDALFCKELPKAGRLWFTKRVLDYQPIATSPDVKAAATTMLTKARKIVEGRLAVRSGSLVDDLKRAEQNELRARIMYGALGTDLSLFIDGRDELLLNWVVERRYRAIQRMQSFINPNRSRKIFAYPAAGVRSAQVNSQSRSRWEGVTPSSTGPATYPFVLTSDGQRGMARSLEILFTRNDKLEDQTRVDCPAAAMITHLDSLLVATDPSRLGVMLVGEGRDYIAIDHPFHSLRVLDGTLQAGFGGWVNRGSAAATSVEVEVLGAPPVEPPFERAVIDGAERYEVKVTALSRDISLKNGDLSIVAAPLVRATMRMERLDRSPLGLARGARVVHKGSPPHHAVTDRRLLTGLFEQTFVRPDDLQTGDHIYVANHPLHRSRLGSTIWNGEHSFVLDPWQATRANISVTGHGVLKLTIAQVVWIMLEEINVFLDIARQIVDAWLAIPASKTPDDTFALSQAIRNQLGEILLLSGPFDLTGTARVFNLPGLTYRKNRTNHTYPPYWVLDVEGDSSTGQHVGRRDKLFFDFDPVRDKPKRWPAASSTNRVVLERQQDLVNAGLPPRKQYGVSYLDDNAGLFVFMPLYYPEGTRAGKPVLLGYRDIQDSVILSDPDDWIFVTRPKVLALPAYLSYLTKIGAIPP